MNKYIDRLRDSLIEDPFDLIKALQLSDEIHHAKAEGYLLSGKEDRQWRNLTDLIKRVREQDTKLSFL